MDFQVVAGVVEFQDTDGHRHAAPINAVKAAHELDDGTAVVIWSQVVVVPDAYEDVIQRLGWRRW